MVGTCEKKITSNTWSALHADVISFVLSSAGTILLTLLGMSTKCDAAGTSQLQLSNWSSDDYLQLVTEKLTAFEREHRDLGIVLFSQVGTPALQDLLLPASLSLHHHAGFGGNQLEVQCLTCLYAYPAASCAAQMATACDTANCSTLQLWHFHFLTRQDGSQTL